MIFSFVSLLQVTCLSKNQSLSYSLDVTLSILFLYDKYNPNAGLLCSKIKVSFFFVYVRDISETAGGG